MADGNSLEPDAAADTGDDTSPSSATVLVVDADAGLRESVVRRLESRGYAVRTAADVAEGRSRLDDCDVDIALIERRLPDGTGDELLAEIRSRNLDCRVAMLIEVDPNFDILEIDCDDYLVKPVDSADVEETVTRLELLDAYSEKQRQLSTLRVKRNVLEVEKDRHELDASEEFARLERRITALESELDDLETEFDDRLGYVE